eukprot:1237489-Amphidinium_carterae.1
MRLEKSNDDAAQRERVIENQKKLITELMQEVDWLRSTPERPRQTRERQAARAQATDDPTMLGPERTPCLPGALGGTLAAELQGIRVQHSHAEVRIGSLQEQVASLRGESSSLGQQLGRARVELAEMRN